MPSGLCNRVTSSKAVNISHTPGNPSYVQPMSAIFSIKSSCVTLIVLSTETETVLALRTMNLRVDVTVIVRLETFFPDISASVWLFIGNAIFVTAHTLHFDIYVY